MKYHRSLKPEDVKRHGPEKVALMVASEFGRASTGCNYREDVISCFERARELMGILETVPLDDRAATFLKPVYEQCIQKKLFREEELTPDKVRKVGSDLAAAFEKAAHLISSGFGYA